MLTVQPDAACAATVIDPFNDETTWPCGAPSRFVVERDDGDPSYAPAESCEHHLAGTVAGMIDGDEKVRAVVTIRWDAPEPAEDEKP